MIINNIRKLDDILLIQLSDADDKDAEPQIKIITDKNSFEISNKNCTATINKKFMDRLNKNDRYHLASLIKNYNIYK